MCLVIAGKTLNFIDNGSIFNEKFVPFFSRMNKIDLDLQQFIYSGDLEIEPVTESSNDVLNSHPINDLELSSQELPTDPKLVEIVIPNFETIEFEDDTPIPTKKDRKNPLSLRGAPKLGPHICECCGKKFNFKSEMNVHQQQKSGQRAFVCPIDGCNKAYAVKKRLTEHMKRLNHIID